MLAKLVRLAEGSCRCKTWPAPGIEFTTLKSKFQSKIWSKTVITVGLSGVPAQLQSICSTRY